MKGSWRSLTGTPSVWFVLVAATSIPDRPGTVPDGLPFSWRSVRAPVQQIPLVLAIGRDGAREGCTG
ncbi:hypothetical protein SSIG_07940 [Streptomyces filamentosus NRRL 11379]|nr:hypothetical protein SSIG_07940 [Streptomyces filamentosus NRRL 11379]